MPVDTDKHVSFVLLSSPSYSGIMDLMAGVPKSNLNLNCLCMPVHQIVDAGSVACSAAVSGAQALARKAHLQPQCTWSGVSDPFLPY